MDLACFCMSRQGHGTLILQTGKIRIVWHAAESGMLRGNYLDSRRAGEERDEEERGAEALPEANDSSLKRRTEPRKGPRKAHRDIWSSATKSKQTPQGEQGTVSRAKQDTPAAPMARMARTMPDPDARRLGCSQRLARCERATQLCFWPGAPPSIDGACSATFSASSCLPVLFYPPIYGQVGWMREKTERGRGHSAYRT